MGSWEVVTVWRFPPGVERVAVTRHWFRWTARFYVFALFCQCGPRPIGIPLRARIRRRPPPA